MSDGVPDGASLRASVGFWASALLALFAVRLPYLASPFYVLDNDEAVLGMMARRIASGSELPLYFAGQGYGLALFEALPAAVSFRIFGDSPRVLAMTLLVLFLAGLIPYSRALARVSGSQSWARVLTVMLALWPGWVVWSMKARGLYVSGFVLTGCALALLTRPAPSRRDVASAGLLLGLLALIQPLWLTVTVPFLVLLRRTPREVGLASLLAAAVWLLPTTLARAGEPFWDPGHLTGFTLQRLAVVPRVLTEAFAGRAAPHQPGVLANVVGGVGTAAFFVLVAAMIADVVRNRSRFALAVAVGMTLSVVHVTVLRVWVPRYFLPSTVLVMIAAATWLGARSLRARRGPLLASVAMVALLALAATRLGRPSGPSRLADTPAEEDLLDLIAGLEADGVRGVYTTSPDVQWQLLFYGRERIPTRGQSSTDRFPEFPRAVAEARRSGQPTAFVADLRQLRRDLTATDSFPGYRVGERYLRLDEPPVLLLFGLGFESDRSALEQAGGRRPLSTGPRSEGE